MQLTSYGQFHEDLKQHGIGYAAEQAVLSGFDSVELLGLSEAAKDTANTSRLLSSYGLGVTCFSAAINLRDTPKRTRAEAEAYLYRCADAAAELRSPYLHHTLVSPLSLPPNAPELREILSSVADSAERVARYCDGLGLTCLYEPQGMYFNGLGLEAFFEEMKKRCQNVGICGDVGNSLFVDHAPERIFDRFGGQILHVHLKDYDKSPAPRNGKEGYRTLGGNWLYDTELGNGDINIPYCLQRLKDVNYDGAYAFEITGDGETMKRAIAYLKQVLKHS